MAVPILSSFLQHLVYPAGLTVFGLIGNAYILGGQIQDFKDDLGGQIHEVRGDVKEMKGDIKGLLHRQTDIELHDMALMEKLVMDCGKKK